MDTNAHSNVPNQATEDVPVSNDDNSSVQNSLASFQPKDSGQLNRALFKQDVREGEADPLQQTIGLRSTEAPANNANNYFFGRTVEFPQPTITGIGSVLSTGAKDTTRYFFSQNWVTAKTGTGAYTITHNIGDNKYNVILTVVATASFTAQISQLNNNDFRVLTFNAAGAAADCAFTFVVYMIP